MPLEIEKKILTFIDNELPDALSGQCQLFWQSFLENIDTEYFSESLKSDSDNLKLFKSLPKVWACSEVVARWCIRHPQWLQDLSKLILAEGRLGNKEYQALWAEQLTMLDIAMGDEKSLYKALRQFRNKHMLRIIWRDISDWSDLQDTIHELSALAEICINAARDYYVHPDSELTQEFGLPYNDNNEPQELIVIAMGKLGARELNLSSDIDLIFAYQEDGETKGGKKDIDNASYFVRLGKKVIAALNNATEDGFVFRVDMRLRPFGDGGVLASSYNGLENYYQIHGREWERYAMIKARVVAGSKEAADELMQMLRPFIYRRYMDYGAYESMRELKTMIKQQVKRKGMQGNVKLGSGGIREIEFIGQVFQLIRGGRDVRYQRRELLHVLEIVKQEQRLPEYVVDELTQAYEFLRNTEHRLQALKDQQTHQLPETEVEQIRLAYAMNFDGWDNFIGVLEEQRIKVNSHFEQVFDAPQTETDSGNEILKQVWMQHITDEQLDETLIELGYQQPAQAIKILNDLRESKAFQTRTTQGQQRLNQLMPMVIGAVGQVHNADITLQRLIEIIEQIAKRSVYMSLLIENPLALSQLVKLCEQSAWVTHYISLHPLLLDDLLDPRSLYVPATKDSLQQECYQKISETDPDDDERIADVVRHFKQSNILRVAAADLAKAVSLMRVSDHLSWIAEVVLDVTLEQAWHYMLQRHGRPVCSTKGEVCDKGFAIIGYGKLGGYELGYGSDLDMVFLHGAENDQEMTIVPDTIETENSDTESPKIFLAKPRSIVNSVFFARLGQRLIHLLSARTAAGTLYEVDMRLRPDGASGMLVSQIKSYEKYQLNKAWVWEHQALVRARAICGDPVIIQQFNKIRLKVLIQTRDIVELKTEVLKMREKMRQSLSRGTPELFDIKQGEGGIVDIEFIVQFGVLAWANEFPELCEHTDNISLLHVLQIIGKLSNTETAELTEAYKDYRHRLHLLALQENKGLVENSEFESHCNRVRSIWKKVLLSEN